MVVRKEGEQIVRLDVYNWYDEEIGTEVVPGKVTGAGIYAEGKKVSLKATANKGFVFAGWRDAESGDPIEGDYLNPNLSYVMGDGDAEFIAHFIPIEEDWVYVDFYPNGEYATGEEIGDIYVYCESMSLATVKVTGLPSGLKFTDKAIVDKKSGDVLHEANTIYGTPTKSGVYTVTATATTAGKKTATTTDVMVVRKEGEQIVRLDVYNWYDEEIDTEVVPGKVTGAGIYAEGKKVSLKATANKGFVFAGWWDRDADDWFWESDVDYRNPSFSFEMGSEDKSIGAIFVTAEEDTDILLYVDGEEITADASDNNFLAEVTAILGLELKSVSVPKAAVSGLPAGMKYTDKALTVKATKTEDAYDVPANSIYGTPTKPGVYTVTVKLTNATVKKAIEKKFTIEVPNLTAANGYFLEGLGNGVGEKYALSVGISNIDDFLPDLRLNSSSAAKLAVSGLPAGLKYNAKTGKITGTATKAGIYTVTLTVTDGKEKYVSTFTIEVEALPDWVVGTFEGYFSEYGWYDESSQRWNPYNHDWEAIGRFTATISASGKVSGKFIKAHEQQEIVAILQSVAENAYNFSCDYLTKDGNGWDERGCFSFSVYRDEYDGVSVGLIEGFLEGAEYTGGDPDSSDGPFYRDVCAWRNLWDIKGVALPKVAKSSTFRKTIQNHKYDIYGDLALTFSASRNSVSCSFKFEDEDDRKQLKMTKCTAQMVVTGYDSRTGIFDVLVPVYMKHLDEPGDDEWIDLDFLIPIRIDGKGNIEILWDEIDYAHDDWWS